MYSTNSPPIHLQDKVNRSLGVLEQYEIISPVNKEEQRKGNTFINNVLILAKGESQKNNCFGRKISQFTI